ncbi:MAG: Fe-S protein assembly co-chaperone HscB [Pseudomonadales bacterium]|mgnify:CR=1 FL=1
MDFNQNYFEIFQLPQAFELDLALLSRRNLELQKRVHPDKFVDATTSERRLSMQWTTQINEAYATLGSSLRRAIYLLTLEGKEIANNPQLDPMFLMEQIELREELEQIEEATDGIELLDHFRASVSKIMKTLEGDFSACYAAKEIAGAEQAVYKMQFINKLAIAANNVEEKLLDY